MDLIIKNGQIVNHCETFTGAIGIDKGKIVATGSHSQLIEISQLYKQLYELQDITL